MSRTMATAQMFFDPPKHCFRWSKPPQGSSTPQWLPLIRRFSGCSIRCGSGGLWGRVSTLNSLSGSSGSSWGVFLGWQHTLCAMGVCLVWKDVWIGGSCQVKVMMSEFLRVAGMPVAAFTLESSQAASSCHVANVLWPLHQQQCQSATPEGRKVVYFYCN